MSLSLGDLGNSVILAVFVGFAFGKSIGILSFSWLAVRAGIVLMMRCPGMENRLTLPVTGTWYEF